MTNVSLKIIEQSEQVGMFSICFDNNEESEFEKFLNEFKDNATYNTRVRDKKRLEKVGNLVKNSYLYR